MVSPLEPKKEHVKGHVRGKQMDTAMESGWVQKLDLARAAE